MRQKLQAHGYPWLRKRQKRRYDGAKMRERNAWVESVVRLSDAALKEKLSFAMDGVILAMPPGDQTGRWNYCKHGTEFMWRKPSESFQPDLAGDDAYGKQVPQARAIPLWGGCAPGGFAIVAFHHNKKLHASEWATIVRSGKLTAAIRALSPVRKRGPWHVLCDNESFLDAAPCAKAHMLKRIKLWHIPPRSPDLNPVEQVWAHLKRKLKAMDLADAVAQRPLLGKTAYKLRVRRLVRSRSFQRIAANVAMGLKKTCKEVIRKRGAAAGR